MGHTAPLAGRAAPAETGTPPSTPLEALPVAVMRTDAEGRCRYVNRRWCALTGRHPETAVGLGWLDAVIPDEREDVLAAWTACARDGVPFRLEHRLTLPDGALRWVTVDGSPEAGEGCTGVLVETTGRRAAQAAEERHRLVLRNLTGVGVALWGPDLRCQLVEGEGLLPGGPGGEDAVGLELAEVVGEELAAELEPALTTALEGFGCWLELTAPGGDTVHAVTVGPYVDGDGEVAGALVVSEDVTRQRAAERDQRSAERQLQLAFDSAPIGMAHVSLAGDFLHFNAALERLSGRSRDGLCDAALLTLVHPDHHEPVAAAFAGLAAGEEEFDLEHRGLHADGRELWLHQQATLLRDDDGAPLHVLLQVMDVTARREAEHRLRHAADHDPLTGLLNRRGFEEALEARVAWQRRYGGQGTVLMLDLDGFKAVNDQLGHATGDALLVACGRGLQTRLRTTDTLARLGGDEFAVLLPEVAADGDAAAVAAALVAVVREAAATVVSAEQCAVTVSVGVADLAPAVDGAVSLGAADAAMYEAKAAGRDRFVLAGPA